jgi:membrane-associated phospholipid phosphatase
MRLAHLCDVPCRNARSLFFVAPFVTMVCAMPHDARADQERTVQWNDDKWRRVGVVEGVVAFGMSASILAIDTIPLSDHASWHDGILFDDAARNLLRASTAEHREEADRWSNFLYPAMLIEPFVIDNWIAAAGVHQNADVALQLTLIDIQSMGLAGVVTLGTEHLVGRARPRATNCVHSSDGAPDVDCNDRENYRSFYAGHAAAAFVSAGLTCVHHQHLPLWGGGAPDAVACVAAIGVASVTSALRIVADEHWASDVMVGLGVGVATGYVLPALIHYGLYSGKAAGVVHTSWGWVVPAPQAYPLGGGLGIAGVF